MGCQAMISFVPGVCDHYQQYTSMPALSNCLQFSSSSRSRFSLLRLVRPVFQSSRRCTASISLAMDVPDYLPVDWKKTQEDKPLGPQFDMTAEEAVKFQLEVLRNNDQPHTDHGVEVMYKFAGFDPFQLSSYFGSRFDLGKFESFRRVFHHSTYRVLLGHKEARVLSSLLVNEHCFKQRVWVRGSRPEEEEIFEFTLVQRVGGCWDGYWLTQSLRHDGDGINGSIAY